MLRGEVLFNGHPRDGAFWRESAYVKQDDVHIPVLTMQVRPAVRPSVEGRKEEDCLVSLVPHRMMSTKVN